MVAVTKLARISCINVQRHRHERRRAPSSQAKSSISAQRGISAIRHGLLLNQAASLAASSPFAEVSLPLVTRSAVINGGGATDFAGLMPEMYWRREIVSKSEHRENGGGRP